MTEEGFERRSITGKVSTKRRIISFVKINIQILYRRRNLSAAGMNGLYLGVCRC